MKLQRTFNELSIALPAGSLYLILYRTQEMNRSFSLVLHRLGRGNIKTMLVKFIIIEEKQPFCHILCTRLIVHVRNITAAL